MKDDNELYIPLKQRRKMEEEKRLKRRKLLKKKENVDGSSDVSNETDDEIKPIKNNTNELMDRSKTSLIDQAYELRKERELLGISDQKIEQEKNELKLLKEASQVQTVSLVSAQERAEGIQHTESLKTTWNPPSFLLQNSESPNEIRKKWHILVDGEDLPIPIKTFANMRFPPCILESLKNKNIIRPTPIQVQAIPCILSGRDLIGIAFTGSGKTITFTLPLILRCLEEEIKMPIIANEGPFGLIIGPSRELMRQTYEVVKHFTSSLVYPLDTYKNDKQPSIPVEIRSLLCIGGEDRLSQIKLVNTKGVHIIVATPGRLNDLLNAKKINLRLCNYICLDEGDRMLDLGFDEEVANIFSHFKYKKQRQTVLFSATMPKKFQDFAKKVLVRPILVNVGRAGAANLDVIQEVEYVKEDAKIVYLLECLQKTSPPVLIFSEKKKNVDDIHEYLLLKGISAVSIHGDKTQKERNEAIDMFKNSNINFNSKKIDVLVATDVAAKGLDFPEIKHVINYDMPTEIENYVHRIGRTGRSGKTGIATTFINKNVPEAVLLDLKHLLIEAKQRVPPVLLGLEEPNNNIDYKNLGGTEGCAFCGGLGHRIADCLKLDSQSKKIGAGKRDYLGGKSEGYGGDHLG